MIRRYKRHYCTSLSDKKTVLWFPRQNIDHYTHSLCDHCNEIIRTICVAAQTSLRLFLNRILCFLNLEFPQIWTLFLFYINGYFSFVGTFITGFPFQNSLSVAFDVVEKKKKSQDIFMTFLKWISFPTSVPLVLRVFLIVVARIDSSMPHWSLSWVEALFQG